jgi:hypothetical protein
MAKVSENHKQIPSVEASTIGNVAIVSGLFDDKVLIKNSFHFFR